MKIGLDVMGGDYAPDATISGAILALDELAPTDRIVLIGDQQIILTGLKEKNCNPDLFEIINASQVIEMCEQPIKSYTQKPNSSIALGFRLLKQKDINTFASAGNSGAMLVGSIYTVKTIQGIIRPCITAVFPKENNSVGIVLDVGTVPDCKPDVLYQFAILGSLYAEYVYNIKNPKVGLLNIGEEEDKGNVTCQSTFRLMKGTTDFNFIGNIESRYLFTDKADVIVCDGFTGNIVLKQAEAFYNLINNRGLSDDYFKKFDYENYGGTPILGIESTVLIGHGISNDKAIKNMLIHSKHVHEANLSKKIKNALTKFHPNKKIRQ